MTRRERETFTIVSIARHPGKAVARAVMMWIVYCLLVAFIFWRSFTSSDYYRQFSFIDRLVIFFFFFREISERGDFAASHNCQIIRKSAMMDSLIVAVKVSKLFAVGRRDISTFFPQLQWNERFDCDFCTLPEWVFASQHFHKQLNVLSLQTIAWARSLLLSLRPPFFFHLFFCCAQLVSLRSPETDFFNWIHINFLQLQWEIETKTFPIRTIEPTCKQKGRSSIVSSGDCTTVSSRWFARVCFCCCHFFCIAAEKKIENIKTQWMQTAKRPSNY